MVHNIFGKHAPYWLTTVTSCQSVVTKSTRLLEDRTAAHNVMDAAGTNNLHGMLESEPAGHLKLRAIAHAMRRSTGRTVCRC